jgi:hypothetical protein
MQIKSENQKLTIKISQDELGSLHGKSTLIVCNNIGTQRVCYACMLDKQFTEISTRVDIVGTCIRISIHIPEQLVNALQDMGRSKEGLVCRTDHQEIVLQVDLRGHKAAGV